MEFVLWYLLTRSPLGRRRRWEFSAWRLVCWPVPNHPTTPSQHKNSQFVNKDNSYTNRLKLWLLAQLWVTNLGLKLALWKQGIPTQRDHCQFSLPKILLPGSSSPSPWHAPFPVHLLLPCVPGFTQQLHTAVRLDWCHVLCHVLWHNVISFWRMLRLSTHKGSLAAFSSPSFGNLLGSHNHCSVVHMPHLSDSFAIKALPEGYLIFLFNNLLIHSY